MHFVQHAELWIADTLSVFCVGLTAAETCESGQPAGGLQEEKTAALGV